MWSSVALPALIAASVTILVNAGVVRTWQIIVRLWNMPRADNIALASDGFRTDQGGRTVIMCVVRCAPSRRFRTLRAINREAARQWVGQLAPGLSVTPDRFSKDWVRFQTPGPFLGGPETFVNLQANGLAEFGIPLTAQETEGGFMLSIEEVSTFIRRTVTLVNQGYYRQIYGTRRRLDWAVSIGGYRRVEPTNQSEPWAGLTFGDEVVGGRAISPAPAVPIGSQFGEEQLKNLWPWTKPSIIIRATLVDWLFRSGYWEPRPTIDQLIQRLEMTE